LANHWNAILLLDEAEIFVEQRGQSAFNDRLVCVFLRILEYFEGLMFLTTNKVKKIDEAMWSRIDYMKQYPPLSLKQRQQLFSRFLGIIDSDVGHECFDEEINTLAENNLNGREVNKVR
jgi:SpoVK/Ycf46/Vps4 family AAA+-type ATPase